LEEDAPELKAEDKAADKAVHEKSIATARNMLVDGLKVEKVAAYTNLSIEEVSALAGQVL